MDRLLFWNMRKFIGNKTFYKMLLGLMIPIMVQNGITTFVNLLDNIMVGRIGTEQMSGVAIANQLMLIFNLCIFGAVSGAGIFGAQFYGKGDEKGVRNVMRIKLWFCVVLALVGFLVFTFFDETFIRLYLHEGSDAGDLGRTLQYGKEYLSYMRWTLLPYALVQAYASTLRETGKTVPPMRAGIAAVLVNLVLNWVLIFGNLGLPALGVSGAAIATLIARFVELGIVCIWTHRNSMENAFVKGLFASAKVPGKLLFEVIRKGMPLLVNELLWSTEIAFLNQCYSVRGLSAVAATNIASTIEPFFNIVMASVGACISIIVGNHLGANRIAEARADDNKLIAFSVVSSTLMGIVLFFIARPFTLLYNTTEEVRRLGTFMVRIIAVFMPVHAFTHATYFSLRSGGKTLITFLFDSVIMWVTRIPLALALVHGTDLSIEWIYFLCNSMLIVKAILGFFFVRSDAWMQNIVGTDAAAKEG